MAAAKLMFYAQAVKINNECVMHTGGRAPNLFFIAAGTIHDILWTSRIGRMLHNTFTWT